MEFCKVRVWSRLEHILVSDDAAVLLVVVDGDDILRLVVRLGLLTFERIYIFPLKSQIR